MTNKLHYEVRRDENTSVEEEKKKKPIINLIPEIKTLKFILKNNAICNIRNYFKSLWISETKLG